MIWVQPAPWLTLNEQQIQWTKIWKNPQERWIMETPKQVRIPPITRLVTAMKSVRIVQ